VSRNLVTAQMSMCGLVSLFSAFALASADAGSIKIPLSFNRVPFVRARGHADDVPVTGSDQRYGEYSMNVVIGGQVFTVMIDTGSSDLAIGAVGCNGCQVKLHPPYNPTGRHASKVVAPVTCDWCSAHSSGSTDTHCKDRGGRTRQCTSQTSYADESFFVAALYNDSFTFADGDTGIAALEITTIVGAIYRAKFPNPKMVDGIIGFAFKPASASGAPTALDTLATEGKMQNVFSLCFQPNGRGGHLYLGTDGPSGLTASGQPMPISIQGAQILETQWTPMLSDTGFYGVGIEDVSIAGKSLGVSSKVYNAGMAIVDSGTQDVNFPATAFKAIKSHFAALCKDHSVCLKGVCDCKKHKALKNQIFENRCVTMTKAQRDVFPMIEIKMSGGVTVKHPPTNYLKNGAAFCDSDNEDMYTVAISSSGPDGSGSILGESFMQGYLVVHDRQQSRMGFQPVSESNCPSTSTVVV